MLAVVLQARRALLAVWLQARRILGANADAVADLDALLGLLTDADCFADDFVADTACWSNMLAAHSWDEPEEHVLTVWCWAPAGAKGVNVTAADAAMRDLDIHVGLLKRLDMRELAPDHLALGRVLVLAEPSLELVVLRHLCCCSVVLRIGVSDGSEIEERGCSKGSKCD